MALLAGSVIASGQQSKTVSSPSLTNPQPTAEVRGSTQQKNPVEAGTQDKGQQSLWKQVSSNVPVTIGILSACIAALVTLTTFVFNYRATLRNQRDTQFYEALKRFGDQNSIVLRSSAAGLIGQMAEWKSGFRHPYLATALDQFFIGQLLEVDPLVRESIGKAIRRLSLIDRRRVIEALYENNMKLQRSVVSLLGRFYAAYGATQLDADSVLNAAAMITAYKFPDIQALALAHTNRTVFPDALAIGARQLELINVELRIQRANELEERLQTAAQRLQENCRLLAEILQSTFTNVSIELKETKKGFKTYRKLPFWQHRGGRALSLGGVFLPEADFGLCVIDKVNFEGAILNRAQFQHASVLDSNFSDAYLDGANFSDALLKSTRFGKIGPKVFQKVYQGYVMEYPITFASANLCNADFRGTEFVKAIMRSSSLDNAKMYSASVVDADEVDWLWENATWWKADFSESGWSIVDDGTANKTKATLALLHRKYGQNLPDDKQQIHQSISGIS